MLIKDCLFWYDISDRYIVTRYINIPFKRLNETYIAHYVYISLQIAFFLKNSVSPA